jgi:hypothetical protein
VPPSRVGDDLPMANPTLFCTALLDACQLRTGLLNAVPVPIDLRTDCTISNRLRIRENGVEARERPTTHTKPVRIRAGRNRGSGAYLFRYEKVGNLTLGWATLGCDSGDHCSPTHQNGDHSCPQDKSQGTFRVPGLELELPRGQLSWRKRQSTVKSTRSEPLDSSPRREIKLLSGSED